MHREGRLLERVVASIENIIDGGLADVQSPAFIQGRLSGIRREVDVAITGRIGSATTLAIIEVRDRKEPQGVDWIEQLSTKRRDVGAKMAIAVSSSGFSPGAKEIAVKEGIELRTLVDVDTGDLLTRAFWRMPTFYLLKGMCISEHVALFDDSSQYDHDGKIVEVGSNIAVSAERLVSIFPPSIWECAEHQGNIIRFQFRLKLPRADGFALEWLSKRERVLVPELYVDFQLRFEEELISYKAKEYSSPDGFAYGFFEGRHDVFGAIEVVVQTAGEPRQHHQSDLVRLPATLDKS